ncbi:MAG: hypothetical protein BMS9Abin18_0336 [Zetaproteobacteria bacterium]|nr:MAG: hypothetical protein BMS9Abin18_0336 [Zetaproteobacteria bacterium]
MQLKALMQSLNKEEFLLSLVILATAGISPNIFVAAQAGIADMKDLALWLLIPAIIILILALLFVYLRGHTRLVNRVLAGAAAGVVATVGLEAVRMYSFHHGGMPGDLPRLMGVLLTDQFMVGPSSFSDFMGYAYHYWNGASFGIVFAVFLGRKTVLWGVAYGIIIGTIFLMSPPVDALGIGFMGKDMPTMPLTVYIAHLAYGGILGWLCHRWVRNEGWLLTSSNGS